LNKQQSPSYPLRTCIAGLGGYGRAHHVAVHTLEQESILQLIATCDPRHAELGENIELFELQKRGVAVLDSFEEMLARFGQQSDLITLATPIPLHAPMHKACTELKKGCYLEKPPTLDPEELASMIQADQTSPFATQVGFAFIGEAWRHEWKEKIQQDEFGPLLGCSYRGLWQRTDTYYNRSSWAGRLQMNGGLVLDSCFGNAMSHHIHNLLFFAGSKGLFSWAEVESVRAELYRANPIEGADTVFAEARVEGGRFIRAATSHATATSNQSIETVHCEKADLEFHPYKKVVIHWRNGEVEEKSLPDQRFPLIGNMSHYAGYIAGQKERPLTTLADCRPFVHWNCLNYLAAGHIQPISENFRDQVMKPSRDSSAWCVRDIEKAVHEFARSGSMPSEQEIPWAKAGGTAVAADLPRLRSTIERLAQEAGVEATPTP
jgi:predicted dehydrogenase